MHHNGLGYAGIRCSLAVMFNVFIVYSEEERKQGSHERGSLTMHTLLAHVEKSGTHLLTWEEGEKGNI